jgi:lipoyl-dependent peroxiredoxin
MIKRHAKANWQGTGKEGKGTVSTQTKVLDNTPYSFASRFKEGKGTNPEELIAAAHAGCFSMKLSFLLTSAGFPPENIDTKCTITMDADKGEVTESHLNLVAKVSGIGTDEFNKLVSKAKDECPISKLLNSKISVESTLNN